jgi:hypothetical protein
MFRKLIVPDEAGVGSLWITCLKKWKNEDLLCSGFLIPCIKRIYKFAY